PKPRSSNAAPPSASTTASPIPATTPPKTAPPADTATPACCGKRDSKKQECRIRQGICEEGLGARLHHSQECFSFDSKGLEMSGSDSAKGLDAFFAYQAQRRTRLLCVSALLEEAEIPYAVIGGNAVAH